MIVEMESISARGGPCRIAHVEFDFGAVKGIKSKFLFRTDDERVDYIPVKRSLFQKLSLPFTFWLS
jgi:hypothetical protein